MYEDVVKALADEHERLRQERAQLQSRLDTVEVEVGRLAAALDALGAPKKTNKLGHNTKEQISRALARAGESAQGELARQVGVTSQTAGHWLRRLQQEGNAESSRSGRHGTPVYWRWIGDERPKDTVVAVSEAQE